MKLVKCLDCGSTALEHFKAEDNFIHVICTQCGFQSRYIKFLPCGHCELEIQEHCSCPQQCTRKDGPCSP